MKYIKFYCETVKGDSVLFQILKQEGIQRYNYEYEAPNGVNICSSILPALKDDTIYLRGWNSELDDKLCCSNTITKVQILDAFKSLAQPKKGDVVEVSIDSVNWLRRTYITTIVETSYPYICVTTPTEEKYQSGEPFDTTKWKYIKTNNSTFTDCGNNEYVVEWE